MKTSRQQAGEVERIALSVNETFEEQIKALSDFYKIDQSKTLKLILEELFENPELQQKLKKYVGEDFRLKSSQNPHRSNMFKNLYLIKGTKEKLHELLKGETGHSEFIRGIIDYYYVHKIEKANQKIEQLKEQLKKAGIEPDKTLSDENGVYLYFKY